MKRILYTLLLLAIAAPALRAADPARMEVTITDPVIRKVGEKVEVSFDMNVEKYPANIRTDLHPVLFNSEGRRMELPEVTVSGRRKHITDSRRRAVEGDRFVTKGRDPQTFTYTTEVPFAEWMQTVGVSVDKTVGGCCSQSELPNEVVADDKLLYYDVVPAFSAAKLEYELTELEKYDLENPFLHPMEEYANRYDILLKDRNKGTAAVTFKVGSAVIDLGDQSNIDALNAISKAFELIEADPNAILKHIMVAGYASPEGNLATNTRLAQARATAVRDFLRTRMRNNNDGLFEIYNGQEDWMGLRELVANSSMPEKSEILDIIDSYTMEQEVRKTRLKQLGGGAPYRYMLDNFYPRLRKAGYVQVYYEIDRKATVATAVNTEDGRTVWIDPDSPANRGTTAINNAVDLMVAHRFAEALAVLEEFESDSRAWNNIGVCHMMTGDYEAADGFFERALAAGDQDAARNLEQIKWARKVEK